MIFFNKLWPTIVFCLVLSLGMVDAQCNQHADNSVAHVQKKHSISVGLCVDDALKEQIKSEANWAELQEILHLYGSACFIFSLSKMFVSLYR